MNNFLNFNRILDIIEVLESNKSILQFLFFRMSVSDLVVILRIWWFDLGRGA